MRSSGRGTKSSRSLPLGTQSWWWREGGFRRWRVRSHQPGIPHGRRAVRHPRRGATRRRTERWRRWRHRRRSGRPCECAYAYNVPRSPGLAPIGHGRSAEVATLKLVRRQTSSGRQVVDLSALGPPQVKTFVGQEVRAVAVVRLCLQGVDPGDNSTVFGRNRFPSCSPARWWSGRDRKTGRDSLKSDRFRGSFHWGRLSAQVGAGTPDGEPPPRAAPKVCFEVLALERPRP
jgi:hypothetical protein